MVTTAMMGEKMSTMEQALSAQLRCDGHKKNRLLMLRRAPQLPGCT
jgi:hypothetical protein